MKKADSGGFTIIELIVAMIVGVIFVIATESTVSGYLHTAQSSRELVLANSYVEGKVESLRSAGYNSLSNGTTNVTSELPSDLNPPKSASVVVSTPSAGIKKIDLSVTYNDQGTNRTYSYTTYMGELGVGQ